MGFQDFRIFRNFGFDTISDFRSEIEIGFWPMTHHAYSINTFYKDTIAKDQIIFRNHA